MPTIDLKLENAQKFNELKKSLKVIMVECRTILIMLSITSPDYKPLSPIEYLVRYKF